MAFFWSEDEGKIKNAVKRKWQLIVKIKSVIEEQLQFVGSSYR